MSRTNRPFFDLIPGAASLAHALKVPSATTANLHYFGACAWPRGWKSRRQFVLNTEPLDVGCHWIALTITELERARARSWLSPELCMAWRHCGRAAKLVGSAGCTGRAVQVASVHVVRRSVPRKLSVSKTFGRIGHLILVAQYQCSWCQSEGLATRRWRRSCRAAVVELGRWRGSVRSQNVRAFFHLPLRVEPSHVNGWRC
jgi:hypothetical protein